MVSERMKAITTGIMSVELAMQREFAYKQKIEKLEREFLQQFNEKVYTPMSPTMTDVANQICAMQSQVLNQGEFPKPTPNSYAVSPVHSRSLHCQPASMQPAPISCPTPLAGPSVNAYPSPHQMLRPSSSLTHTGMKRTEPSSGQQQQFQPPNYARGDSKYFCKLCRVDCQTPYNLHMHLKGSKHKARAAMMSRGKEQSNAAAASRRIHCELCDVCCTDGHSWKQHIEGKNHLIKKQKKILDYRESR